GRRPRRVRGRDDVRGPAQRAGVRTPAARGVASQRRRRTCRRRAATDPGITRTPPPRPRTRARAAPRPHGRAVGLAARPAGDVRRDLRADAADAVAPGPGPARHDHPDARQRHLAGRPLAGLLRAGRDRLVAHPAAGDGLVGRPDARLVRRDHVRPVAGVRADRAAGDGHGRPARVAGAARGVAGDHLLRQPVLRHGAGRGEHGARRVPRGADRARVGARPGGRGGHAVAAAGRRPGRRGGRRRGDRRQRGVRDRGERAGRRPPAGDEQQRDGRWLRASSARM
ncbi:MAG: hypothetical protein AVDCRST_MAG64-1845, partial [uncultured Phycisphaerae bacterium]